MVYNRFFTTEEISSYLRVTQRGRAAELMFEPSSSRLNGLLGSPRISKPISLDEIYFALSLCFSFVLAPANYADEHVNERKGPHDDGACISGKHYDAYAAF
jgi:hypothetical protein